MSSLFSGPSSITPWIEKTVAAAIMDGSVESIETTEDPNAPSRPRLLQVVEVKSATFRGHENYLMYWYILSDGKTSIDCHVHYKLRTEKITGALPAPSRGSVVRIEGYRASKTYKVNGAEFKLVEENAQFLFRRSFRKAAGPRDLCLYVFGSMTTVGGLDMGIVGDPQDILLSVDVRQALEAVEKREREAQASANPTSEADDSEKASAGSGDEQEPTYSAAGDQRDGANLPIGNVQALLAQPAVNLESIAAGKLQSPAAAASKRRKEVEAREKEAQGARRRKQQGAREKLREDLHTKKAREQAMASTVAAVAKVTSMSPDRQRFFNSAALAGYRMDGKGPAYHITVDTIDTKVFHEHIDKVLAAAERQKKQLMRKKDNANVNDNVAPPRGEGGKENDLDGAAERSQDQPGQSDGRDGNSTGGEEQTTQDEASASNTGPKASRRDEQSVASSQDEDVEVEGTSDERNRSQSPQAQPAPERPQTPVQQSPRRHGHHEKDIRRMENSPQKKQETEDDDSQEDQDEFQGLGIRDMLLSQESDEDGDRPQAAGQQQQVEPVQRDQNQAVDGDSTSDDDTKTPEGLETQQAVDEMPLGDGGDDEEDNEAENPEGLETQQAFDEMPPDRGDTRAHHSRPDQLVHRDCAHPAFRNATHAQIAKEVEAAGAAMVGKVLIRPRQKRANSLAMHWVVREGIVKVIEIAEEDKETPASIGQTLKIKDEVYGSNIEEVIANFVDPMNDFVEELVNHPKFHDVDEEELDERLLQQNDSAPQSVPFAFCWMHSYPGYASLRFVDSTSLRSRNVAITPRGFSCNSAMYRNLDNLVAEFWSEHHNAAEQQDPPDSPAEAQSQAQEEDESMLQTQGDAVVYKAEPVAKSPRKRELEEATLGFWSRLLGHRKKKSRSDETERKPSRFAGDRLRQYLVRDK